MPDKRDRCREMRRGHVAADDGGLAAAPGPGSKSGRK